MTKRVVVIEGEDVAPEAVRPTVQLVDQLGLDIEWVRPPVGENGIFEHFPRLTVVHVEADAGWVPCWLQRMEQHHEFSGNAEQPRSEDASDRVLQAQRLRRLPWRRDDAA